jgi:hypothetical protein
VRNLRRLLWAFLTVAVGMALLIGAGFLIAPKGPAQQYTFAILGNVVVWSSAGAIWAWAMGKLRWRGNRRAQAANAQHRAAWEEQKRRRVAELAHDPDPARRKYAELVERGVLWSDAEIAYAEDPGAMATCVHLQPVERAIRQAGMQPRLVMAGWRSPVPLPEIQADCTLDEDQLKRQLTLDPSVHFREDFQPERSATDNPFAELWCQECHSRIHLVHSKYAASTTPRLFRLKS